MNDERGSIEIILGIVITLAVFIIIPSCMYSMPKYNVYRKDLSGKAQLKEAEWSRQISVREAVAKKDSAKSLAEAEIIRAHGVAEANKIIGNSLKNNDSYLRYLWIQGLQDGSSEVIYIPTEDNLPILEARGVTR